MSDTVSDAEVTAPEKVVAVVVRSTPTINTCWFNAGVTDPEVVVVVDDDRIAADNVPAVNV
jgi:hypothetical protein